jgi:hypothetical protein
MFRFSSALMIINALQLETRNAKWRVSNRSMNRRQEEEIEEEQEESEVGEEGIS